jgi:hypothetical protein
MKLKMETVALRRRIKNNVIRLNSCFFFTSFMQNLCFCLHLNEEIQAACYLHAASRATMIYIIS